MLTRSHDADCHCQATVEPLDSHFEFRDSLLTLLIQMEQRDESTTPLRFQYKAIAQQFKANPRLVRNTFRSLRQDGILYLLDATSDTYLLISRRVLAPFVGRERPEYLAKVPQVRLDYLRRSTTS